MFESFFFFFLLDGRVHFYFVTRLWFERDNFLAIKEFLCVRYMTFNTDF
jgi:hypothetical protein